MGEIIIPEVEAVFRRYRELTLAGLATERLDEVTDNLPNMVRIIKSVDGNSDIVVNGIRAIGKLKLENNILPIEVLNAVSDDPPQMEVVESPYVIRKEISNQEIKKEGIIMEVEEVVKNGYADFMEKEETIRDIGKKYGIEEKDLDELITMLLKDDKVSAKEKEFIIVFTNTTHVKESAAEPIVREKKKMSTRKKVCIGVGVAVAVGAVGTYFYMKN